MANNYIKYICVLFNLIFYSCSFAINTGSCLGEINQTSITAVTESCRSLIHQYHEGVGDDNLTESIGAIHLQFSRALFQSGEFDAAEEILFKLKSDFSTHLESEINNYQWYYLSGKVKIRLSDYENAILNFQESLRIAKLRKDDKLMAHSLVGIGLGYQKLNQYEMALNAYKESLFFRLKYGDSYEIGVALNNIANTYKFLEDYKNSLEYYLKANENYLSAKKNASTYPHVIVHSFENIGIIYNKLGHYQDSVKYLQKANEYHMAHHLDSSKVRLLTALANSYQQLNELKNSFEYYQQAIVEDRKYTGNNAILRFELAQSYYDRKDMVTAKLYLVEALERIDIDDAFKIIEPEIYLLKSRIQEDEGKYKQSLASYKTYTQLRAKIMADKSNQNILNITHKIDIAETEYELLLLEKENRLNDISINRQYWIIFSLALLTILIAIYVYHLVRKGKIEKGKLVIEIGKHKQKLARLEGSKNQLKAMFKGTSDAILCINSAWSVAFHNDKFTSLINNLNEDIKGQKLKNILPELFALTNELPLNDHDLPHSNLISGFEINVNGENIKFNIRVNTINLLDDFTVFAIGNDKWATMNEQLVSVGNQDLIIQENNNNFRSALVDLMQGCLEIWSRYTKTNRIELAEASGFWNVSIDDGRLRTRALDRYLDRRHLPANPRWRSVVKTAHYILSEVDIDATSRDELNHLLGNFTNNKKEFMG
jgi:tetratricopeptide (TPR) repeat protein